MSQEKNQEYHLTQGQKLYYSSVLLLEDINNFGKTYPIILEGDDEMLEPLFIHMVSKGWLSIENGQYKVTSKGREVLLNYLERLTEFRSVFKVYSAVDTGAGTFGYAEYFSFDTDEQFMEYINQDQFEDLRVAVCEMKGINPLDVIFLEFVDTGKYDFEQSGWQADLVTGLIWDEMLEVANSNIHVSDLTETDANGNVTHTGEEVMKIIMKEGSDLMMDLIAKQEELDNEAEQYNDSFSDEDEGEETYFVTEYYVDQPVYDVVYYEVYYDPFYFSPCWGVYYY
jgi:hypothetical protein